MKISEVREMSTSELKEKLYSLKEQLFEFVTNGRKKLKTFHSRRSC